MGNCTILYPTYDTSKIDTISNGLDEKWHFLYLVIRQIGAFTQNRGYVHMACLAEKNAFINECWYRCPEKTQ